MGAFVICNDVKILRFSSDNMVCRTDVPILKKEMTMSGNTEHIPTVYLSSTFTSRMLPGSMLVFKRDIELDEARKIITYAENSPSVSFVNAVNPVHTSTAVLTEGLTDQPASGGFVSLKVDDTVIVIYPSKASRDATEYQLNNLEECKFCHIKVIESK